MTQHLSEHAYTLFRKYGLPLDDFGGALWWGCLPGLQRADAAFDVFAPERRARLNALADKASLAPADLTKRDFAFYSGALAEVGVVLSNLDRGGGT